MTREDFKEILIRNGGEWGWQYRIEHCRYEVFLRVPLSDLENFLQELPGITFDDTPISVILRDSEIIIWSVDLLEKYALEMDDVFEEEFEE